MRTTFARSILSALLIFAFAGVADAQQRKGDARINLRGQITAFEKGMLTVKALDGDTVMLAVPKRARISGLTRVDFSELKKGDFIASAGLRQSNGTLKAIDVRIFPAKGRHPPEVYRKYRLGPESRMTNATVDAFIGGMSGRTFKVTYKGGEQTIVVPEDAYVMRQDPGSRTLLKAGANVSVLARKGKDGRLSVIRMAVGINGLMPPT